VPEIESGTSGFVTRNSDHQTTEAADEKKLMNLITCILVLHLCNTAKFYYNKIELTALLSSGHTVHAMLSAEMVGNEYIGNWNPGTFLTLQECQIHSHHPALLSDWNLSLETILYERKKKQVNNLYRP
jgi:hypothetical protein